MKIYVLEYVVIEGPTFIKSECYAYDNMNDAHDEMVRRFNEEKLKGDVEFIDGPYSEKCPHCAIVYEDDTLILMQVHETSLQKGNSNE